VPGLHGTPTCTEGTSSSIIGAAVREYNKRAQLGGRRNVS
jgi:hypothetical protein